jgi:class 3 adenylate cyclase
VVAAFKCRASRKLSVNIGSTRTVTRTKRLCTGWQAPICKSFADNNYKDVDNRHKRVAVDPVDLGFGVGIAHGFATVGTIGFEGRFDYAAIGTVSNVASRLCDEAKPGQILISPRVLMAVEDAVSVEPVGEFKLKGISWPLAAYNILLTVSPKI